MHEMLQDLCALCMISALCAQLQEGGRFYQMIKLLISFRIMLVVVGNLQRIM